MSNTTGINNTANGVGALFSNTTIGVSSGHDNTATEFEALVFNTIGFRNTATGSQALLSNTTGNQNTAIGDNALFSNTTANFNTAIGRNALRGNTGSGNTALGFGAGSSLTTGNSNIDIGNTGAPGEFETIRIGASQTRTFIAGIRGVTTGNNNAVPVLIDAGGQLGTTSSSRRYKKEIKAMDQASESILRSSR